MHLNNRITRCTGFILNEKNELLLLEHINIKNEKYWWFPGGGLENNEDFENGLKREIKEELNLDINITKSFIIQGKSPERVYKQHFVGVIKINTSADIRLEHNGKGRITQYKWFYIKELNNTNQIIRDKDIFPIVREGLKYI